jgi:hypothetical protein
MPRPTCKGCGAIVRWITTTAGKPMICDPEKLQEWVTDTPRQTAPKITLVTSDGQMETGWQASVIVSGSRSIEGYVPHWATCPKAKDFKR